jgi:hypothetical protein
MLTTEQLNAIKERAEKATNVNNSGWYVDEDYSDTIRDAWDCELIAQVARGKDNDAEFIAQARTDIPALIAEVERLRKEISFIANVDMTKNAIDAEHVAVSVKGWALDVLEGGGADD